MKTNIYVVRASHMQPFFHSLQKLDVDIEFLLQQAGLTLTMFDDPQALVPEAPLWEFVEISSQHLKMPHFGFYVTENVCLDRYGAFGEHLCSASHLESALTRFINDLNTHTNFPNYWLEETKEYYWLCRQGTPGIEKGKWPVEQHVISFLIELIKIYAGKDWQPRCIKFASDSIEGVEQAKSIQTSQIVSGQPFGAIAIEKPLMQAKSTMKKKLKSAIQLEEKVPVDLVKTLQKLMEQGYFGELLGTELIASKMGVNLRTLQRRLKSQNTSLKVLIEQAKYASAKTWLLSEEVSIVHIANKLGYTDTSNFLRAFKRWSGCTPKQFKAQANEYVSKV